MPSLSTPMYSDEVETIILITIRMIAVSKID